MKIIDVNATTGNDGTKVRYKTADEMLRVFDDYTITSAIVCHRFAELTPWIYNAEITETAAHSGGRIKPCFLLDPMLGAENLPGEGTLKDKLKRMRPAAARLLPVKQMYPLTSFFCGDILGAMAEMRLPLMLEYEQIGSYQDLVSLAREYPALPVIILRPFFNHSRVMTPMLTKLPNIYVDMCVQIDTGYLEELVEVRGVGRKLLFGSGLPDYVPSGILAYLSYSTISAEQKEDIYFRNWERLEEGIIYDD